MNKHVTIAPDGSRDIDVQSLFYDQLPMVRRIARMDVKEAIEVADRWRGERVISVGNNALPHAVVALADEVGKLHAAQQRIAELEGERDRLQSELRDETSDCRNALAERDALAGDRDRLIDELRDAEARNAQKLSEIARLREALSDLIDVAAQCDSWESFPSTALESAERAL